MTLRPLKSLAALLFLALPVLLPAQTASSSSEEVRLEKLMADSAQWYVPRTTVSVGFRVLSSGGKVQFGNLGSVAYTPFATGADRLYDNGAVRADAPRPAEKDANGNVTTTPGGRYPGFTTVTVNVKDANGNNVLDASGNPVTQQVTQQSGDFLAYTPGQTRSWNYDAASQLTSDGHVAMSTYSTTSEGAGFLKKSGASAGVEFQYVYTFSKPANRLQWGLMAGIALNGISSKTAGSVTSTLHTKTDYYSLNGQTAPTAPYTAPSFVDYTGADGTVYTSGQETTVPLAALPDQQTETATPGGATVNGKWQIKGAYYMLRLGPSLRTQLTPRLGLSASLGLAGAYAGTTYSVTETFQVPDVPTVTVGSVVGTEQTTESKFLGGYYADLNLDWMANEHTGLFGGFTAQRFGGYDQAVGSRTARIDLGSSVGLRGGISIRF
ncbi:hypothetical protein [Opitutus sp. GAS368]|uniref:hypothetical protein n=1 Tax=Opitutus sp. GAS368 TaxID=1882749 RepID=UPI00087A611E|nr:hypothetical protein [Opitutus sp. GAS368]SDS54524.1 hypothetical protein SAMN05444173_3214 [Opitutus sp. GAS368]